MKRFRLLRLPMDCRVSSEKTRFALLPGNDEWEIPRL
jgi:hypothetical protein